MTSSRNNSPPPSPLAAGASRDSSPPPPPQPPSDGTPQDEVNNEEGQQQGRGTADSSSAAVAEGDADGEGGSQDTSGETAEGETVTSADRNEMTVRDELVERYYQYQKDRRELKRRNLQAQTNIVQYLRKHKINNLTHAGPPDMAGKSHEETLAAEYSKMLKKIDALVGLKEQEAVGFEAHIEEVLQRQQQLQRTIRKVNLDIQELKSNAISRSVHQTTGKRISQRELHDHMKKLENVAKETQPVRLEYVKLLKRLTLVEEKRALRSSSSEKMDNVDSVEIRLENRIFNEKSEARTAELVDLERKISRDVIVLAHTRNRVGQVIGANRDLEEKVKQEAEHLDKLKIKEAKEKKEYKILRKSLAETEVKAGLLGNKDLLMDYLKTASELNL